MSICFGFQLRIKVAIVVAMLFPLGCVLGMFFPSGFSCVVARKPIFGWSLSNLIAFLRWNLFTYRNLWEWINKPFDILPLEPQSVQLPLPLAGFGQHLAQRTT